MDEMQHFSNIAKELKSNIKWDWYFHYTHELKSWITLFTEAYAEPCQTSKMERFAKNQLFDRAFEASLGLLILYQKSGLKFFVLAIMKL